MKHIHTQTIIFAIMILLNTNLVSGQDTTATNSMNVQDSTKKKSHKPDGERFFISLGAYRPTVSTTLQINGEVDGRTTPGTVISLEDNLGFNAHPWLIRAEANAAITKRSSFSLYYINLNRKNEWEIDRDVNIFDTTFHVGANLGIYFNTQLISLSYRYRIFSKPTWNAGASFGIRFLRIKTGVELISSNFNDYAEAITLPAPAPVFGLFGSAYLTKRLMFHYNFEYFTISITGIRGNVLDNRFSLEYYFIKNLGIGSSVNFLGFNIKELPLADNFSGDIKYTLNGFSFYITSKF